MRDKTERPATELNLEQKKPFKITLLTHSEGRLLMAGVALAFIYAFWLGIKMLLSPEDSQALVGTTATEIIFGRVAAMAFGYSLDLKHSTVIPMCMAIETISVLIFYPLFVFSWRQLLVINWLKNIFERIRNVAEAKKSTVQKYGIIGLFVFVWIPFWMTGPVVGCVIGFLLGIRLWIIMTTVLAGTCVAIFGWAFFLRQLHDQVASYSPYAAMVLMILLVIIIIVGHLLHRTHHKNKPTT
ncbi:small multi-drug export protein [Planctomycetota bacterium]